MDGTMSDLERGILIGSLLALLIIVILGFSGVIKDFSTWLGYQSPDDIRLEREY